MTPEQDAQEFLDRTLADRSSLRILEAGCGSAGHLALSKPVTMVGIDISARQLERHRTLYVKIQGDLQTYRLPDGEFDVVVCWDVLEHLARPDLALANLAASARPGGVIILKSPNLYSVKGLMTRFTPHRLHVFCYRLLGWRTGGAEDAGPFKTYLRPACSPSGIRAFALANRLELAFVRTFDVAMYLGTKKRLLRAAYAGTRALARVLSLGRIGDSEYLIILRKPVTS
jgi:SAM-dependent methyltransferase